MLTEISRMCNIYKSCVNIIILQVDIIYHACRGQKYATKEILLLGCFHIGFLLRREF